MRRRAAAEVIDWIESEMSHVEQLDARERERGGKWRESQVLAPGEEVIEDARLS